MVGQNLKQSDWLYNFARSIKENIALPLTGKIWCKKIVLLFTSKGLAKENESQHWAIRYFLRIMIVKVYRYKFSQQNGDSLKQFSDTKEQVET